MLSFKKIVKIEKSKCHGLEGKSIFLINKPNDVNVIFMSVVEDVQDEVRENKFLDSCKTLLSVPAFTDMNYGVHLTTDRKCGCSQAFTPITSG